MNAMLRFGFNEDSEHFFCNIVYGPLDPEKKLAPSKNGGSDMKRARDAFLTRVFQWAAANKLRLVSVVEHDDDLLMFFTT